MNRQWLYAKQPAGMEVVESSQRLDAFLPDLTVERGVDTPVEPIRARK